LSSHFRQDIQVSGRSSQNRSAADQFPGVSLFKALGDPNRLKAVLALRHQELCACQIVALLDLAPSTVSRHLQILRQSGVIDSQKRGRWIYYRLTDDSIDGLEREMVLTLIDRVAKSSAAKNLAKNLKKILSVDPETLCTG